MIKWTGLAPWEYRKHWRVSVALSRVCERIPPRGVALEVQPQEVHNLFESIGR